MFRSVILLLTAGAFLISCGSDDESGDTNEPALVVGVWDLVELNVGPAQDLNQDGTANDNLLDELNCISGTLTINAAGTWGLDLSGVTITSITGDLYDIQCNPNQGTNSGSWELQGNQLTLFQGSDPIVLSLSGDRLTNLVGEILPGFFSEVYQKR